MIKKIFSLVVVAIMMLGVYGLAGCEETNLVEYKATKTTNLQEYAYAKRQDIYTVEGSSVIFKAVTDGKKAIEDARTRTGIIKAFNDAIAAIDAVEEEKIISDEMRSGAYCITDESWELYVRNWAADHENWFEGIDEEWIQRAIDGTLTDDDIKGSITPLPPLPYRKSMIIAAYDDQITENEVYRFVRSGDSYTGQTLHSTISFTLSGDILTIKKGMNVTDYKLDESYQLSENESVHFSAPTEVEYTFGGKGLGYATFYWNPHLGSGWLGAGIEVKKAGSEDFELVKIDYPYEYTFVAQFSSTDFAQGINIVRINYIGGPTLNINTNQVYLVPNSEYKTFNVIVSADGNVTIEESNN